MFSFKQFQILMSCITVTWNCIIQLRFIQYYHVRIVVMLKRLFGNSKINELILNYWYTIMYRSNYNARKPKIYINSIKNIGYDDTSLISTKKKLDVTKLVDLLHVWIQLLISYCYNYS